jgi:hypothetical protein
MSSPAWVPLGVLVALVVGAVTIWLMWRPLARIRLSYMVTQTPLVSAEQSEFASRVRVMYREGQDERQLREARTVRVRLVNRSGKDITTAMFDDGSPLVIDLGVPVVATLSEQHVGPSRP